MNAINDRGTTLAEIMIAMLVLSIGVVGVFSAVLAAVSGVHRGETRYQASLLASQLTEELKNYATADPGLARPAPGFPAWHLPGDACTGCPGGPTCWALEVCTHDVTERLPKEWAGKLQAAMRYHVTLVKRGEKTMRQVQVDVHWNPAQP